MNPSDALVQDWRNLAAEAKAGQLVLEPEVAKECAAACEDLIKGLAGVRGDIRMLGREIGLGDYESSKQLAQALVDVAYGKDGFRQRLDEHIDIVKLIHDTVGAQVAKTLATDDDTAQNLKGTETGLGDGK